MSQVPENLYIPLHTADEVEIKPTPFEDIKHLCWVRKHELSESEMKALTSYNLEQQQRILEHLKKIQFFGQALLKLNLSKSFCEGLLAQNPPSDADIKVFKKLSEDCKRERLAGLLIAGMEEKFIAYRLATNLEKKALQENDCLLAKLVLLFGTQAQITKYEEFLQSFFLDYRVWLCSIVPMSAIFRAMGQNPGRSRIYIEDFEEFLAALNDLKVATPILEKCLAGENGGCQINNGYSRVSEQGWPDKVAELLGHYLVQSQTYDDCSMRLKKLLSLFTDSMHSLMKSKSFLDVIKDNPLRFIIVALHERELNHSFDTESIFSWLVEHPLEGVNFQDILMREFSPGQSSKPNGTARFTLLIYLTRGFTDKFTLNFQNRITLIRRYGLGVFRVNDELRPQSLDMKNIPGFNLIENKDSFIAQIKKAQFEYCLKKIFLGESDTCLDLSIIQRSELELYLPQFVNEENASEEVEGDTTHVNIKDKDNWLKILNLAVALLSEHEGEEFKIDDDAPIAQAKYFSSIAVETSQEKSARIMAIKKVITSMQPQEALTPMEGQPSPLPAPSAPLREEEKQPQPIDAPQRLIDELSNVLVIEGKRYQLIQDVHACFPGAIWFQQQTPPEKSEVVLNGQRMKLFTFPQDRSRHFSSACFSPEEKCDASVTEAALLAYAILQEDASKKTEILTWFEKRLEEKQVLSPEENKAYGNLLMFVKDNYHDLAGEELFQRLMEAQGYLLTSMLRIHSHARFFKGPDHADELQNPSTFCMVM